MSDDSDCTAHVLGSQRPPRGILPDHRDLGPARGAGGLRPDDAQACLAATSQCQDVAWAHAGQNAARFISRLALARTRTRLLRLTQLVAQRHILANISVRTRQILGCRVALRLQVGQSRRECDDSGIGLVLRKRRLEHLASLGARRAREQVDNHVVRRSERRNQRVRALRCEGGDLFGSNSPTMRDDRVPFGVDTAAPRPS